MLLKIAVSVIVAATSCKGLLEDVHESAAALSAARLWLQNIPMTCHFRNNITVGHQAKGLKKREKENTT